jgi:hypothetical protein
MKNFSHPHRGETYLEVIIAMGIFIVLSQAVIVLANTGYELIGFTRARNVARTLALTKMEYARNLSFANVGTVGGIPSGTIPQNEAVAINGQEYIVQTTVVYVDDPFDGVSPVDLVPNDYKRVRVEVTWTGLGPNGTKSVLISDIAPKGIENLSGGGTLSFLVFDSTGSPVSNASISIVSSGISPAVNLNVVSNDNGRIVLPGATACVKCYRVTVTKSGMSADRTYGASEVANPAKPDLTVTSGNLTEMSFTIDRTANLSLHTKNSRILSFSNLASQALILKGSKTIGTDTLDNPVYKYNSVVTTDTSGDLTLNNMEWDSYSLVPATASAYTFSGTNPLTPIALAPSVDQSVALSMTTKPTNSLWALYTDAARTPISSVSATLKDSGVAVATASAGLSSDPDFGQVFFGGLSAKTYTLESSVSGYQPSTTSISVNGNTYNEIILNP